MSRQYKALYNRDLITHLNSELDADEMIKFNKVLSNGVGSLVVKNLFLVTRLNAPVLNEKFEQVNQARASTRLGELLETYIFPNGQVYYGFQYRDQMRYVEKSFANTYPINK